MLFSSYKLQFAKAVTRRSLPFGLVLSLCVLCGPSRAAGQSAITPEYLAKAKYIANFPSFIDWPSEALQPGKSTFLVCVFGEYPFGTSLAESMRGAIVNGRRTEVRWVRKSQELSSCQILFVSHSEQQRYSQILETVRDHTILTVGETPDFLAAGGILTFTYQAGKIQFDVNLGGASKAHLKLSSRLLALARYVLNQTETAKS